MPKVSFRMASASIESVFDVQTSRARENHRSGHTEGRLTTTPSGCSVRKGPSTGRFNGTTTTTVQRADGVAGTPTFFIAGARHKGAFDAQSLIAALTEGR